MRPVYSSALFHHQAKTVKSEREEKLLRPTKEPNNQSTKRDPKQDVVATMNSLR